MTTIFTRIIDGEIPGTFVHRDDECVVFMSINPLADGHVLVVPIEEHDHWIDVPADLSRHLFDTARRVGRALAAAFPCERVGLVIAGYEVNHCHIHLVPTSSMRELDFSRAATSIDRALLEEHAGRIVAALADSDA